MVLWDFTAGSKQNSYYVQSTLRKVIYNDDERYKKARS